MTRKQKLYQLVEMYRNAPERSAQKARAHQDAVSAYEFLVQNTYRLNFLDLPPGVDYEDILQEGRIALTECLDDYDPDREDAADFETYAIMSIRRAMGRGIKSHSSSRYGRDCEFSITRATKGFTKAHGTEPTDEELASDLGISVQALKNKRMSAEANYPLYLNQRAFAGDEDSSRTLQEVVGGKVDVLRSVVQNEQVKTIHEAIACLPVTLQAIGLLLIQDYTVKDIAETKVISRKVANALACTVRRKVRKWLVRNGHSDLFEDYIKNRRRRNRTGAVALTLLSLLLFFQPILDTVTDIMC